MLREAAVKQATDCVFKLAGVIAMLRAYVLILRSGHDLSKCCACISVTSLEHYN